MGTRLHGAVALFLTAAVLSPSGAAAQDRLALSQAIEAVLAANPELHAVREAAAGAGQRVLQARAGWMPRVDVTTFWQRGNQPVFVFGSLLAQRQFADANFALGQLNHPDALTNVRTAVSAEQMLFDGGRTRAEIRAVSIGHAVAQSADRQYRNELKLTTARAYGRVLMAGVNRRAAESAIAVAEEDARTAGARRDAGTGSEADALSMQVHLAQMQERAITAASSERIARAELNRLMAAPLDRQFALDEPDLGGASPVTTGLAQQALTERPEIEQARLRHEMARALEQSARSVRLPQVVAQGGYEWNLGRLGSGAPAWSVGAQVRINVLSGGANLARAREAAHGVARAEAERQAAESAVRLEVLTAMEQVAAARAREAVGRAMVMQARESQRIIRDRYEAGMATTSDALRAANAVLDAEAQRIAALVDAMVSEVALHHAVGE